jgi:hypothetical protein
MPRKFKSRKKSIRAPCITVYLEHPVGSNEWHRRKLIEFRQQRATEIQKNSKKNLG